MRMFETVFTVFFGMCGLAGLLFGLSAGYMAFNYEDYLAAVSDPISQVGLGILCPLSIIISLLLFGIMHIAGEEGGYEVIGELFGGLWFLIKLPFVGLAKVSNIKKRRTAAAIERQQVKDARRQHYIEKCRGENAHQ